MKFTDKNKQLFQEVVLNSKHTVLQDEQSLLNVVLNYTGTTLSFQKSKVLTHIPVNASCSESEIFLVMHSQIYDAHFFCYLSGWGRHFIFALFNDKNYSDIYCVISEQYSFLEMLLFKLDCTKSVELGTGLFTESLD